MVDEDEHLEDNIDIKDQDIDAEEQDKPEFNTVVEPETKIPVKRPAGKGLLVSGFAVASLIGGALGIAGAKYLDGTDKTIALKAEFEQSLKDIKNDLQKTSQNQTQKLGTASSARKKTSARLADVEAENKALAAQIGTLEQDLMNSQTAQAEKDQIALAEYSDRIAVLETIIQDAVATGKGGDDGENTNMFKGAASLTARLQELENAQKLTKDIVAGISAPKTETNMPKNDAPDSGQDTTSEVVESNANSSSADAITPEPENISKPSSIGAAQIDGPQDALGILIDTFPRTKLLAAVKAQEELSKKKPGWLQRALSKHVRVRDDDIPDPYAAIDAAEVSLKDGQISTALAHLKKLNPPVRTSAAEWIQAAKKAAPIIEQDK